MNDLILSVAAIYTYPLITLATVLQGPVVMTASGFLLRLGYLSLIPTYIALMIGDLIGDIIWYTVGYHMGRPFVTRFGKYFSVTEKGVQTTEEIFHRHKTSILFISKITMGFGFALVTLITAGIARIPFRHYLLLNFLGQFVWTAVLLAFGYFFAHLIETVSDVSGKVAIVAGFTLFFLLLLGLGKYLRNIILERYRA
ncbi:MAG TPA: DedA family protein [Candidatus Paceibacterota bacterium]